MCRKKSEYNNCNDSFFVKRIRSECTRRLNGNIKKKSKNGLTIGNFRNIFTSLFIPLRVISYCSFRLLTLHIISC